MTGFECDAVALKATDTLLLVRLGEDHDSREVWVPKSAILPGSGVMDVGNQGVLSVTSRFARKAGLL